MGLAEKNLFDFSITAYLGGNLSRLWPTQYYSVLVDDFGRDGEGFLGNISLGKLLQFSAHAGLIKAVRIAGDQPISLYAGLIHLCSFNKWDLLGWLP